MEHLSRHESLHIKNNAKRKMNRKVSKGKLYDFLHLRIVCPFISNQNHSIDFKNSMKILVRIRYNMEFISFSDNLCPHSLLGLKRGFLGRLLPHDNICKETL